MISPRLAGASLLRLLVLLAIVQPAVGQSVSMDFIEQNDSRLDSLFAHLDPELKEIGPLIDEWNSGERKSAAEGLAEYFESRQLATGLLDEPSIPQDVQEQADAALHNSFFILDAWEQVPVGKDGHLDWNFRGDRHDKEVAWMLNRHPFIPLLAEAYQESGDKKYRLQVNTLWSDWIIANPYPGGLSFSPPWRALETARRILNSWTYVFFNYTSLDSETRLLVLSSILDHADSLHNHASFWGGNHLISEKLALLTLAYAWPEFKSSPAWKEDAIKVLTQQFLQQTYPDGSFKELSNHYQRVVLVSAQYFIRLLASLDPDYASLPVVVRIREMWNFFAKAMRPDGFGPLNNASDLEPNKAFVLDVWMEYDRPDWLFISTNGESGKEPEGSPSDHFPWAGQVFIRDSWKANADWIYFDAGPYGTAHQHVDRMHLSAFLDGNPILVDSGRYTYKPGSWKDYFRGPGSHNVILLDDMAVEQGPREVDAPLPIYFNEQEEVIMVAAQSRFAGGARSSILPSLRSPVPWTRAVLYDKRGFVLIFDHIVCFEKHKITAFWNFHPDVGPELAPVLLQSGSIELSRRSQMGVELPDIGGFFSPDYNIKLPSVRLVHEGEFSGPTTFSWILQPVDEHPLSIEVTSPNGAPFIEFSINRREQPVATAMIQLYPEPALIRYEIQSLKSQN